MNFGYPELIYQYNKLRYNDSVVDKLNQIDINELILNSDKYINQLGNFNVSAIENSYKKKNHSR